MPDNGWAGRSMLRRDPCGRPNAESIGGERGEGGRDV